LTAIFFFIPNHLDNGCQQTVVNKQAEEQLRMNEMIARLSGSLRWKAGTGEVNEAFVVFESLLCAQGLSALVHRELGPTDRELHSDAMGENPVFWSDNSTDRFLVTRHRDPETIVLLSQSNDGRLSIDLAASDEETAQAVISRVRKGFPPAPVSNDPILPITFWSGCGTGSTRTVQKIRVVRWNEISSNYCGKTSDGLASLVERSEPRSTDGRLLLWHGEPGTGKTFAIRALAWTWKEWCRFEYVIDPEELFSSASYLMEVLLHSPHDEQADHRWRLLLVEDSGELMGMDAKSQVGQGLSRLLNVSDRLLGQGTKIMILVTTNEDLGRLNSAIMRPGRCMSEIEFLRFSVEEGNRWLRNEGNRRAIDASKSLSELYAIGAGVSAAQSEAIRIGFYVPRAC
jgi:ATPase family associated with various cellular activities (AAA)